MSNATYCLNGHFVDAAGPSGPGTISRIDAFAQYAARERSGLRAFCTSCGATTINACQHCQAPIELGFLGLKAAYCGGCGRPFPWTEATLVAAKEYTDELEELSAEEKVTLKGTFDDLTVDTPRTELAAHRFQKFIRKIGPTAGDVLIKIMVSVATEAAKKGIGI